MLKITSLVPKPSVSLAQMRACAPSIKPASMLGLPSVPSTIPLPTRWPGESTRSSMASNDAQSQCSSTRQETLARTVSLRTRSRRYYCSISCSCRTSARRTPPHSQTRCALSSKATDRCFGSFLALPVLLSRATALRSHFLRSPSASAKRAERICAPTQIRLMERWRSWRRISRSRGKFHSSRMSGLLLRRAGELSLPRGRRTD